jgi:hypothetical protein
MSVSDLKWKEGAPAILRARAAIHKVAADDHGRRLITKISKITKIKKNFL